MLSILDLKKLLRLRRRVKYACSLSNSIGDPGFHARTALYDYLSLMRRSAFHSKNIFKILIFDSEDFDCNKTKSKNSLNSKKYTRISYDCFFFRNVSAK